MGGQKTPVKHEISAVLSVLRPPGIAYQMDVGFDLSLELALRRMRTMSFGFFFGHPVVGQYSSLGSQVGFAYRLEATFARVLLLKVATVIFEVGIEYLCSF